RARLLAGFRFRDRAGDRPRRRPCASDVPADRSRQRRVARGPGLLSLRRALPAATLGLGGALAAGTTAARSYGSVRGRAPGPRGRRALPSLGPRAARTGAASRRAFAARRPAAASLRGPHLDLGARDETRLAVDDDLLAGRQALGHDGLAALR